MKGPAPPFISKGSVCYNTQIMVDSRQDSLHLEQQVQITNGISVISMRGSSGSAGVVDGKTLNIRSSVQNKYHFFKAKSQTCD